MWLEQRFQYDQFDVVDHLHVGGWFGGSGRWFLGDVHRADVGDGW